MTDKGFAEIYFLRAYGTALAGRNAGKVLDGWQQTLTFCNTLEGCLPEVEKFRGTFQGRVQLCSRTYHSRCPKLGEGEEWTGQSPRHKGFVVKVLREFTF